jgi:VanZ family protein
MMLIIFLMSEISGVTIQKTVFDSETVHVNGHFMLFFLLCIAYYKAVKDIVTSILFTAIYAFTDEFHQMYTLLRSPSFFDIKVDIIGAILAGVFLWKLTFLLPKSLKNWLEN